MELPSSFSTLYDYGQKTGGYDFSSSASDYAKYRLGFPAAFYDRLLAFLDRHGLKQDAVRVLDVGTGTGAVAIALAQRGARVTALDPSAAMLEQAEKIAASSSLAHPVSFVRATAEQTTLQEAGCFDVCVFAQSFHWVKPDQALAEVKRLLQPNGFLVLASHDYLPLPGTVAALTEEILKRYNPTFPAFDWNGFYGHHVTKLQTHGFKNVETWSFDVEAPYTHTKWRGRMKACSGVTPLPAEKRAQFDQELATMLRERFPNDNIPVLHRVFTISAQK